jgi:hypothetical protein
MKACPVCLVECSDDLVYCPIDGIALLPLVDWSDDDDAAPPARVLTLEAANAA